jgi:hypothetical protein
MPWAAVEPTSYVDSEKETDRRLEQLYTEGLAAFYTEDWDRACQRFQSILSEQPNHKTRLKNWRRRNRQRNLSRLYEQASAAVRSEDWGLPSRSWKSCPKNPLITRTRHNCSEECPTTESTQGTVCRGESIARQVNSGRRWSGSLNRFASIEPNYLDSDGLLPSAQKEGGGTQAAC